MEKIVQIENLVKCYKELTALDHFDLSIEKGEIFGLLGPNGSGKTTTIACLLALLEYEEGRVQVFGEEMKPDSYELKRRIGVVLQNVAVFQELTVYENIDYFCGLYIKDKKKRREYVEEAVCFAGLEEFCKMYPQKLSGGLLRRLNIACGIAHKPELIIMDEPTVAVDPQSRNKILEGILQLNAAGATIIYTSHYMEEVEQICTRIAIMDRGKRIALGTKEELKAMISSSEHITVEISKLPSKAMQKVEKLPHVSAVCYENGVLKIKCDGGRHNMLRVLELLKEQELQFGRAFCEMPTLNDVFLEMTGKELRD